MIETVSSQTTNNWNDQAAAIDRASKIIDPDAFSPMVKKDGCGAYWTGRRNVARNKAAKILFPEHFTKTNRTICTACHGMEDDCGVCGRYKP